MEPVARPAATIWDSSPSPLAPRSLTNISSWMESQRRIETGRHAVTNDDVAHLWVYVPESLPPLYVVMSHWRELLSQSTVGRWRNSSLQSPVVNPSSFQGISPARPVPTALRSCHFAASTHSMAQGGPQSTFLPRLDTYTWIQGLRLPTFRAVLGVTSSP